MMNLMMWFISCSALLRDIKTPQRAQQVLDLLETVVSFVTATGGSLIAQLSEEKLGRMKLGQYTNEVLMLRLDGSNGEGDSREWTGRGQTVSRVVQQQVQLTHLEALYHLMTDITTKSCDVFAKVHEVYKKPLQEM